MAVFGFCLRPVFKTLSLQTCKGKETYLIGSCTRFLSTKPDVSVQSHEPHGPQGVQGDGDANLKLWWNTCYKYGLENCNNQLQGIQSGRKTLSQVLAEQDALITEIAEKYRAEARRHGNEISQQGVQDRNLTATLDAVCPQGIQGDSCAQFKLWLENCHKFGIQNCADDQYDNVKSGRKTLSEIFREQDLLIQSVVSQYQQKRSYSTSPQSTPESPQSTPESPPNLPKSQRERLKQAVKDYGSTVIVFHVAISLISLGGFYLAVSSGVDVIGLLSKIGVGEKILQSKAVSGAGTFVIAYAVHKVFAPVRIGITLTSTPFIVHYLRRIGMLKIPKV